MAAPATPAANVGAVNQCSLAGADAGNSAAGASWKEGGGSGGSGGSGGGTFGSCAASTGAESEGGGSAAAGGVSSATGAEDTSAAVRSMVGATRLRRWARSGATGALRLSAIGNSSAIRPTPQPGDNAIGAPAPCQ